MELQVSGRTAVLCQLFHEVQAKLREHQTPRNADMLRGKSVPGGPYSHNRKVPEEVALAWLEKTHGAKLGDVVMVYGWAVPRDILIEKFRIDEVSEDEWFMWFDGPTAYPKGTERRHNGVPAHYAVYPVTSKRIERFLSWEKANPAPPPPAPVVQAPPPPAPPAKVYPPAQRTDILARIQAAESAGDHEMQDRISLEWFEAVHGVRPGDYVRVPLYGGGTRVIFFTGARHYGLDKPAGCAQVMVVEGPCEFEGKGRHLHPAIHLTESICKVEESEVSKCLKDFVRKSKAKNVVAAREMVASRVEA